MENYFWNTEETENIRQLYVLIIYDIVDNKRRNRFAREMNGYGFRVQKSAFEALIKKSDYSRIIKGIKKYCKDNDSIRIYKHNALSEVTVYGNDIKLQNDDVIVI